MADVVGLEDDRHRVSAKPTIAVGWLRCVTVLCGGAVAFLSVIVLGAWVAGQHALVGLRSDYIPTGPSTAICFLFLGTILAISGYRRFCAGCRRLTVVVSALIAAYGLLSFVQYCIGVELTPESLLFPVAERLGAFPVGRMSPIAGVLFFLAGVSISMNLLSGSGQAAANLVSGLGGLVALSGFVATTGYVFGAPLLYGGDIIPMAALTTFAFLLLGAGLVVAAGPDVLLIRPLIGTSVGAQLLRVFLPLTVSTLLAYGFLQHMVFESLFANRALFSALLVLLFAAAMCLVIVRAARSIACSLDTAEAERKQAEQALRESEEKYRNLVERASDGICIIQDMLVKYLNPRLAEMWGGSAEGVAGQPFAGFVHPDALPALMDRYQRRLAGEAAPTVYETAITRKDGSRLDVEVNAGSITYQGRPADLVIVRDITERKLAEEALWESQRKLELALEGADLGWFDWDMRSGEITINDRYATMLGHTRQGLLPSIENWEQLVHPDDRPRVMAAFRREQLPPFPPFDEEYRMRTRDGGWKWIHDRGRVVEWDAEGRPLRTAGTHLDITARKQAEKEREKLQAQLLQSQKMEAVGRLAAGLAHDFNNLLTAIIGFADLLQMDMSSDDPRQAMVASIERSGRRTAYLVNQLLAFASKQMIAPRSLDLNYVLAGMDGTLRHTLGQGIELTTRCQPDLWPVRMDPDQLKQVVNELALHARDAMPGGGKLTLEMANVTLGPEEAKTRPEVLPGDYVLLAVSDTGAGMSEEAVARIFEPFFIASREVADGKGLRLAAVYGAVKQNKGHVYVESQEGRGTTFKVYLPSCEG